MRTRENILESLYIKLTEMLHEGLNDRNMSIDEFKAITGARIDVSRLLFT
jgi:hypothetical protein